MKGKDAFSKCFFLSALLIMILSSCPAPRDTTAPSLAIVSIRENGVVHSGFLVGTVSQDVDLAAVEVSLDGGAWQAATLSGSGTWTFMLPSGAATWRDGTAHTITARATDTGSNTVTVGPITVRKGVNRDVNGDGYEDLVVGGCDYTSSLGRVYVFHSAGSPGVQTAAAASANGIITGGGGRFGFAVAMGDVNGDGYADVVVGVNAALGRVYVFHSAGSAGVTITDAAYASSTIIGDAVDKIGWSVATGDINADGYADVVAGDPFYSSSTGRVYIFHSAGSAGVTITGATSANTTITGEATTDYLGGSVATGDINGDGYCDVLASAYGFDPGSANWTGRAYVFHSSGAAGVTETLAATADSVMTGEAANNYFGSGLAAGDVNGDGYADVIVGAPSYSSSTGRAYVFHSMGTSGVATVAAASASSKVTGEASSNGFGLCLAAGDVNGDGYADVIVGAPSYSSSTGRTYVFHSTGTAGVTTTSAASANCVMTGEAPNDQFGYSAAGQDVNGDSYTDVVVGARAYSSGTGRAYTFHSSGSTGVPNTLAGSASSILTGEAVADSFGFALAGGY